MSKSLLNNFLAILKRYFIAGILVVVPVILTWFVLKFLFEAIDGILRPVILQLFGYYIPGLGLVTTILLIILAGVITRSYLGGRAYRLGDKLMAKLPLIRTIYVAAKQLLEAIAGPSIDSFKEVALVEYPRKGVFALSFVSNRIQLDIDGVQRGYTSVFVPSTPTPVSGMVILMPDEEVTIVDMTIEEAIKFLVSGGVASPKLIKSGTHTSGSTVSAKSNTSTTNEVPGETR